MRMMMALMTLAAFAAFVHAEEPQQLHLAQKECVQEVRVLRVELAKAYEQIAKLKGEAAKAQIFRHAIMRHANVTIGGHCGWLAKGRIADRKLYALAGLGALCRDSENSSAVSGDPLGQPEVRPSDSDSESRRGPSDG